MGRLGPQVLIEVITRIVGRVERNRVLIQPRSPSRRTAETDRSDDCASSTQPKDTKTRTPCPQPILQKITARCYQLWRAIGPYLGTGWERCH